MLYIVLPFATKATKYPPYYLPAGDKTELTGKRKKGKNIQLRKMKNFSLGIITDWVCLTLFTLKNILTLIY